ncbi:hypothetical protein A9Z65_04165 [Moraxella nonliquefaciens]|nr:hypothetical protein A9Z65_04165 [Moraxella nonliquefaciens]
MPNHFLKRQDFYHDDVVCGAICRIIDKIQNQIQEIAKIKKDKAAQDTQAKPKSKAKTPIFIKSRPKIRS